MHTFFSTPLFRLFTVIINFSMIFPVIGFGFTKKADSIIHQRDVYISSDLMKYQILYYKKLGMEFVKQVQNVNTGTSSQKAEEETTASDRQSNRVSEPTKIENGSFQSDYVNKKSTNSSSIQAKSENSVANQSITVEDTTLNSAQAVKKKNKDAYSAVKNLPDAEKLRTRTESLPTIKQPIPSKDCLINTVDCSSNQNKEAARDNIFNTADVTNIFSSISSYTKSFNVANFLMSNNESLPFTQQNDLFDSKLQNVNFDGFNSSKDLSLGDLLTNATLYDPSVPTNNTSILSPVMLPPGGNGKAFDFDGDGKADISIWRPDTGEWFVLRSSDSSVSTQNNFGLGSLGDRIVPGNYDGDLKTDFAYWRPSTGVWTIKQSSNNQNITFTLGQSGDVPVAGDYDGDGKTDIAVWRSSNGTWYYRKSADGSIQSYAWGAGTDVPVVGDFDGDNKTDFTVVRPSDSNWYILQSSNGMTTIQWGSIGDRLVPGDYDGDGKCDVGVWRANDNTWYVRKSSNGILQSLTWGISADYPVPADYDGDGKTDFAIWRTTSGEWWITNSSNNNQYGVSFGMTGDIPIPVSYVAYFSGSNQAPIAVTGGPYSASVNTAIRFDGRGSYDSDGQVYGYNWNFGDSTTGTGSRPSHTYTSPGNYTITLTVTDNRGAVSVANTSTVTVFDSTSARLDPFNAVGGDNPISQNFSWGTGLAGLPGRSGMGAGISLSYNSLVWLKQTSGNTNYMVFDPDNGFPGPSFRMGMPIIERKHFNSQTGKYGYLMITESGSRIEFRQVGSSSIYETADSSYTQLLDYGTSLVIRTTDGTQHSYQLIGNQFQCVQIKDRNGNYITATYNSFNRLSQITDTLGRVLVVNYDNNGNPLSVAQIYNGQQRVYATLGYDSININTSFSNSIVVGPTNNSQITVLKQVAFDDGSYYRFNYNSYGQVYQIDSYAADGHKLNHVKYNLENPGVQTDCPRFTQKEDYAENWMTVTTQYSAPVSTSWMMPDTLQAETGLMSKIAAPDGTEERIYYSSVGWNKGIPRLTETWGANKPGESVIRQRWVTSYFTQDNTSLSYIQNPRPISTSIGDSGNVRKSTVSYTNLTLPSGTVMYLANDSFEYNSDGSTVYRHSQTDYNLNSEYLNRYIIGLPSETRLYEGSGTGNLKAKTSYGYDQETLIDLPGIIMHDTANYGTNLQWRGNLTKTQQWNINNLSESTTNKVGYNISGNVAWTQDPVQNDTHRNTLIYIDNFSDEVIRNTYAYQTKIIDPDGFSTSFKFHYTTGLFDEIQGPKAGQTLNNVRGAINKKHYDSIDRLEKIEMLNADRTPVGSYKRFEYLPSMSETKSYTKLENTLGENYMLTVLDGYGRTRATATENPSNSNSFIAITTSYNNMGRQWKISNPTETMAIGNLQGWVPTGDDTNWFYTDEIFDWKGRKLKVVNTDGTYKDYLYIGCGCAGGQTVISRDEAGRRKKLIYDLFGRINKLEVLPIQPKSETINDLGLSYSTKVVSYNVLDQPLTSKFYAGTQTSDGSCPTSTSNNNGCQLSVFEYDGFGRESKIHLPEQSANKYKSINYNQDGTIFSETDARGAIKTYLYNFRKQITQTNYSLLNESNSSYFTYDSLGNRLQMTDPTGITAYTYDSLSRMTSEMRNIYELNQSFTRNYYYNEAGIIKKISDPATGSEINYNYDKSGKLTNINNGYINIVSNVKYRAWGKMKQTVYGNGTTSEYNYNERLQPTHFDLKNSNNTLLTSINYNYASSNVLNDGLLKSSTDLLEAKLNRNYEFNLEGLLSKGTAGEIIPNIGYTNGPYEQKYEHNPFGNLTREDQRKWIRYANFTTPQLTALGYDYINNRHSNATYDDDGRLLNDSTVNSGEYYNYDIRGNLKSITTPNILDPNGKQIYFDYDGNGQLIKKVVNGNISYFFRSSILGGKILFEIGANANYKVQYILSPSGDLVARENGSMTWLSTDPSGVSKRETNSQGTVTSKVEEDPLNRLTDSTSTYNFDGNQNYNNNPGGFYTPQNQNGGCGQYGMPCGRQGQFFRWLQNIQANILNGQINQVQLTSENTGVADGEWVEVGGYDINGVNVPGISIFRGSGIVLWDTPQFTLHIHYISEIQHVILQTVTSTVPISVSEQHVNRDKNPNCDEFAAYIVDFYRSTVSLPSSPLDTTGTNFFAQNAFKVAVQNPFNKFMGIKGSDGVLINAAILGGVDRNTAYNAFNDENGFKSGLVAGGQRGDVYHHIIMSAGLMVGEKYEESKLPEENGSFLPRTMRQGFKGYDAIQGLNGRLESAAELADDIQGEKVGEALFNGAGKSREDLIKEIRDLLCK